LAIDTSYNFGKRVRPSPNVIGLNTWIRH